MNKKYKFLFLLLLVFGLAFLLILFVRSHNIAVLNPKGLIASKERSLIFTATFLMLIVVIPVFIMTFFIAWKYRESNEKAKYTPDWDHNIFIESIWWGFPLLIISILGVFAWNASHELDPFKPLSSSVKPVQIQAVALQWKWLFIYPEENIASVNFIQFPENTPINFEITADAPMNSLWIPQLGGQIYAMNGMSTKLHLIANEPGRYRGSSANLSGKGFAGMHFIAQASSNDDFGDWVQEVKQSPDTLNMEEYTKLAEPSENNPIAYYSSKDYGLYNEIIRKFMGSHSDQIPSMDNSSHTNSHYEVRQ